MQEFINYNGDITILQYGILNYEEIIGNGKFTIVNNVLFIEVIGENPFRDFQNTRSEFNAILEFEEKNAYQIFKLTILPDSEMFEFEVIQDKEYKALQSFLIKNELENELNSENNRVQSIKNKKV